MVVCARILLALCTITLTQAASLHRPSHCRVNEVRLKQHFDVKQFAGKWYDIGRLDRTGVDLASGYSQFTITEEGRLQMHYVGEIDGECQSTFTGVSETYWGARLYFTFPRHSQGPESGPYWVVDTDYRNFAVIYGCQNEEQDGRCAEGAERVYVLARRRGIRPAQRVRLERLLENKLCVDPTKMRYTKHSGVECPITHHSKSLWNMWGMLDDDTDEAEDIAQEAEDENVLMQEEADVQEAAAVCKFDDIPVAATFDQEKVLGRWYILATHRQKISGSRSDGVFDLRLGESGYLETYFTGAHDGVCLPTFYGVMRPTDVTGQYTVQNEHQDGPLKFAYLTSDLQYAVTYQCSDPQEDGSCGQVTLDVFGRSQDFPEEVKTELRPVVQSYCVKPTEFTSILHDLGCTLDLLEDEPTCLVEDIKPAHNVDWAKLTGSWYAVAAYKDKEAPSLTFYLQSEEGEEGGSVYYNWMGYSRSGACVEPMKAEAGVSGSSGDLTLTAGDKQRNGKLIFTDNSQLNVFYDCGRVLEDGSCDPSFTKLHISSRSRSLSKHVIRSLKVILKRLCIELEDIQSLDHTVPCEADPELYVANPPVPENPIAVEPKPVPEHPIAKEPVPEHPIAEEPVPENLPEEEIPDVDPNSVEELHVPVNDDACAFVNLHSQDGFDPAKFEGIWYHLYRLTSSEHEFESEINYIEDLQNGQMSAISKHFHDGHCSDLHTTTYTRSKKIAGDWTFGTYGGVKVLYTDYSYAVVYVCDEVSNDGSCDHDKLEVEVLSRNKDAVPDGVKDTLLAAIEGACLKKEDFEEVTQSYECPLFEINCPISALPEQADFNPEKYTGTWHGIAQMSKNTKPISVSSRLTKTEDGYLGNAALQFGDNCVEREFNWELSEGTATYTQPSTKSMMKVLYTDYESALVYICFRVHGDHCVPDKEYVTAHSRTSSLTDRQIIDMVDRVAKTCFTREDFTSMQVTGQCPIDVPVVKIADLPKADDLELEKIVGRWYGHFHLRGHGDWQDGVVDYGLLEDGVLQVTATGSDGEKCLDSVSYLSFPGDHIYERTIISGGITVYIRLLDVNPDNHALLYMCETVLEDGSCDPDRTFVDVLTRSHGEVSEETRVHLRDVLRKAGFAPGDFVNALNPGVECEAVHYPEFSCNVNDLVGMEDVNPRKLSGTWYVVAKLNGSDVLDSEWARIEYEDDNTLTLKNVGYRPRQGCSKTSSITVTRDKATFEATIGDVVVKGLILWTDYDHMMAYDCANVLADGSCAIGAQRGIIMSRKPGRLPEDVIAQMDSMVDQPCANRENYQWVDHTVHCPMERNLPDSCKPENIETVTDITPSQLEGVWYATYLLRHEARVKLTSIFYNFTFIDEGIIHSKFSMKTMDQCIASSLYMHPTDKPGVYTGNLGHLAQTLRFVHIDANNMVAYKCVKEGPDGFCEENEEGVIVHTRHVKEPSDELLDKARALAKKLCFQPGDFVRVEHGDYCPLPEDTEPLACSPDEMPVKENFEVDRFTGTWYAVASLKGFAMMPSSMSRVVQEADGSFSVLSTGMQPRGGCRHVVKARVVPDDDLGPGDVYLETATGKQRLRILYTDYAFALTYQCVSYKPDGNCRTGSEVVTAYARTPHFPDDAIERMLPAAEKACFTRNDFKMVPQQVLCHFEDYDPLSCRVRDIPTQENFQLDRFVGTWYSHFKFPSDWETLVSVYEQGDDGTVTLHFSGEINGECAEPMSLTMSVSKGNPAVMYAERNGHMYGAKVVHTDYVTNAVVYACGQVLEDGTCAPDKVYVQVLGRSLDPIPVEEREHLKEAVRDTCFETGDFMRTTHSRNCEPFRELDCLVSDLPVQEDFNMNKFTGKWNVAARLRNSGQMESGVIGIKYHKEGEYLAYITGALAGQCQTTKVLTLHPNYKGQTADMHVEYGDREGFLRVLYTDYENALLYLCEEIRADGRCVPSKLRLVAVTRGEIISNSDLITMAGVAKKACFTADQFEWVKWEIHCTLDVELMDECKPANLLTADSVTLDQITGTWYLRYTLRGRLHHDSALYKFDALENGDLRYEATAALDGECMESTVVSLVYQTDDPASWRLNSHRIGEVEGEIKVLFMDDDFAVIYECDKEDEEGFCYWNKIQVSVLSRNKDALTPERRTELIGVARTACLEPGMFAEVEHPVECPLSELTPYTCEGGDLPSVEDFSMEKMTGTWYAVARLKGSPVPNSFVTRISSDGQTYHAQFSGARRGRCIETAASDIMQAEDGSSKFHIVHEGEKLTVSHILYTDYEVALIRGCLLLLDDGSCAQGHDQVAVYARSDTLPAEDAIAKMEVAGHPLCVDRSLFEAVRHDLHCPIHSPVLERCLEVNIPAAEDLSLDNLTGTWYSLYRLRNTGNMDYGTAHLTMVDEHHIQGEFAFSVSGKCVSAETMYHHVHSAGKSATGEFYTNIGRFQASVKIVAANYDYMLLYECEHVEDDGLCSEGGRFVGVFGRSQDPPPPEILAKLRQLVRDVCLEPGDFVATEHTGECEVKLEKASLKCALSDLPSKQDHVYNKDTGTWYGIAKLKGSNFLNSHVERGVFDEKEQAYKFYFAGERARGGCTPTGSTVYGAQVLGQDPDAVYLMSGGHKGMWRIMYNDYKYSLIYECSHMLDKDTCAPGYEAITAYSRRKEKIPEHMIVKMFENIPQNCFTRDDFEWIPQTTACPLEFDYPDCRVRQIPVIENLDIDQVLGTWYSRYLLTAHAAFDSYSVRYEKTDAGLKGHYTGIKMGECQRSVHLDIDVPNSGRGVWHRAKNGNRVVIKLMWTDYRYAAVYTCDEVLGDDHCAPNKDYIDVLARDLDPIPVTVIESLKRVLKRACYEPGDLVESDHKVACEEDTCSVAGVKTQKNFKVSDVYGDWNLIGRTTHLKLDRGPSSMRIMKSDGENAMLALARQHEHGCNTFQSQMLAQGEATFTFSFSGLPGLLRVIHASDEHLLVYECFGAELVDGYCPPENEEIQAWDREYHRSDEHESMFQEMAQEATCVDLSQQVVLPQNTECKVPDSCKLSDFIGQEELDPRSLLGTWMLRVRTTFHTPVYNSNHLKFAYSSSGIGSYSIAGDAASTGECISHLGTVTQLEDELFKFEWDQHQAVGKFLLVTENGFILLECLGELVFGECPLEQTLISGYTRPSAPPSDEDIITREVRERTHGCFHLKGNVVRFEENDYACDEPADPPGKLSCDVGGLVPQDDLDTELLEGAWFLIARTGTIDLAWDAGILHAAATGDEVIELKYTGLVSYNSDECLAVYTETMTHDPTGPGHFGLVTERLGGLNSVAKILYLDEDHFIWYECQGSRFTSGGSCQRESEHVEVFSRRRRINSVDKQKLVDFVKDTTCVDLDTFVMANHTKKCELPGVTDHKEPHKSCKLSDYPTQDNFNPEQFAGLWYEIERTRYAADNIWESGLSHFEHKGDNMMTFSHTGSRHGECSGPFTAFVRPVAEDPADLLMYIGDKDLIGSPWSVYFKYKVIYTDYEVAITHACLIWDADGTCRHPGEQVDILSRSPDLAAARRSELYDVIRQNLCIDVHDLVEPAQEESCHMKLGLSVPVDCSKKKMCKMYCKHGFVTGDDGCPVCDCKEPEELESSGEGSGEEKACPQMMCMIECEFGFQTDENGCDTCTCNACPQTMCMIECEFGFQTDENGCDTCTCNACPQTMCMIECEFGFQTDENGCDTCTCNACPQTMCMIECEFGFQTDENGCDMCACNACPQTMCMIECEFGFQTDENGCDTCTCNACPQTMCMIECEFGFQTDENGCDMCTCNACPQTMCMIECEFGFQTDENGCDTCTCNACPQTMCMIECEFGFQTDDNGCDTCTCNACPQTMCMIECEFGFQTDENGCDTCTCNAEEEPANAIHGEDDLQTVEEVNAVQGQQESVMDVVESLFDWFN